MIDLHSAIFALNPSITIIRGEDAFDKEENLVSYDLEAAKAKLVEMQNAEKTAKQTAMDKLTKLGLTAEEIAALGVA